MLFFYADDLAIVTDSTQQMTEALKRLEIYCRENHFTVNIFKTKTMKIKKSGDIGRKDIVLYKGQPLEYVNSFKYLGVTISAFMKNYVHISKLHRKGITSVNILAAKVNFQKISFLSAWRLQNAVVFPSCFYGLSTTFSSTDVLGKVLAITYFWKRWAGISKFTPNLSIICTKTTLWKYRNQNSQEEGLSLCFTRMASITKIVQVETATETLRRHFALVISVVNI